MNEAAGSPSDAFGEVRRALSAMALGAFLAAAILAARSLAERRRHPR
jgi:hypothetical protein